MGGLPDTVGVFVVSGSEDFLIHIAVADTDGLYAVVIDRLTQRREVADVCTSGRLRATAHPGGQAPRPIPEAERPAGRFPQPAPGLTATAGECERSVAGIGRTDEPVSGTTTGTVAFAMADAGVLTTPRPVPEMRMGAEMGRPSQLTVFVDFQEDRPVLARRHGYSTRVLTGSIASAR